MGGLPGCLLRRAQDLAGTLRLSQQHRQRGDRQIPFNQGGDGALLADLLVERPDGLGHGGAVGVDIEGPLGQVLLGKTGQVNFADRVEVDSRQIVVHLQAVIDRAHMEVVEIEQDAATAAPSQLGQKLGLPHLPRQLQVGGGILDEQLSAQCLLHPIYLVAHVQKSGPGVGHGQQIVEIAPADAAPAQVLRHPHRRDGRHQGCQLAQVPGIERIGGAQRHADSVKAHGVVPRKLRQHLEALAVALEVVFAVYLKPAHSGQGVADLVVVRGA